MLICIWTGVANMAQLFVQILLLLDYIPSGLLETKPLSKPSLKEEKLKKYSEMPLGLGQSSAISLMLPRQFDLEQVYV